jgi:hypothetical protein
MFFAFYSLNAKNGNIYSIQHNLLQSGVYNWLRSVKKSPKPEVIAREARNK